MKTFNIFLFLFLCIQSVFPQVKGVPICPSITDILINGYNPYPSPGNYDEFGIVETQPFLVKVNDDIPRKAFPKTVSCGQWYYMSFDTDLNIPGPINYRVIPNQWNSVFTFQQTGSTSYGYALSVKPPLATDVGGNPRFIMRKNGNKHMIGWNESKYPLWNWNNFVHYIAANDVDFGVTILGNPVQPHQDSQTLTANIVGGNGHYIITWFIRIITDQQQGCWLDYEPLDASEIWVINGQNYYIYNNEHKFTFTMPTYYGDPCAATRLVAGAEVKVMIQSWDSYGNTISSESTINISAVSTEELDNEKLKITNDTFTKLEQNYPNPFNPSTTIKFNLPTETKVALKIYDILGNEIATLVDEFKIAGQYEVKYVADNLPSGVYFYQLITENNVEIKKFILTK